MDTILKKLPQAHQRTIAAALNVLIDKGLLSLAISALSRNKIGTDPSQISAYTIMYAHPQECVVDKEIKTDSQLMMTRPTKEFRLVQQSAKELPPYKDEKNRVTVVFCNVLSMEEGVRNGSVFHVQLAANHQMLWAYDEGDWRRSCMSMLAPVTAKTILDGFKRNVESHRHVFANPRQRRYNVVSRACFSAIYAMAAMIHFAKTNNIATMPLPDLLETICDVNGWAITSFLSQAKTFYRKFGPKHKKDMTSSPQKNKSTNLTSFERAAATLMEAPIDDFYDECARLMRFSGSDNDDEQSDDGSYESDEEKSENVPSWLAEQRVFAPPTLFRGERPVSWDKRILDAITLSSRTNDYGAFCPPKPKKMPPLQRAF